jgi:hypothetical protein
MTKRYSTTGVVPPEVVDIYRDEEGNLMRDGGATWDNSKKAWRRTLWKLGEPKYKVTYDDGKEEFVDERPEEPVEVENPSIPIDTVKEIQEQKDRIVKIEDLPPLWELQSSYVSPSEKPEWDAYFTKEITDEAIIAPMPVSREKKGNWFKKRLPKISRVGVIR